MIIFVLAITGTIQLVLTVRNFDFNSYSIVNKISLGVVALYFLIGLHLVLSDRRPLEQGDQFFGCFKVVARLLFWGIGCVIIALLKLASDKLWGQASQ